MDSFGLESAEAVSFAGVKEESAVIRHRCVDPRVALGVLVALNIAIFASPTPWIGAVAVVMDAALMAWCGRIRLAAVWVSGYVALILLGYCFMFIGSVLQGTGIMFFTLAKIMPTAMFAALMVSTTYVGEMAWALQSFGLSNRVTVAICVALRFFPTALREAKAVREAMLTRGIRITPIAFIKHPVGIMEDFLVPYIHRISIVADELGDAVMVRGIEASRKRTSYCETGLKPLDVVVICLTAVLLVVSLWGAFCL